MVATGVIVLPDRPRSSEHNLPSERSAILYTNDSSCPRIFDGFIRGDPVAREPCEDNGHYSSVDEIDAIGGKRESAQREMERRIVAQMLTCMDDLAAPRAAAESDQASPQPGRHVVVIGEHCDSSGGNRS